MRLRQKFVCFTILISVLALSDPLKADPPLKDGQKDNDSLKPLVVRVGVTSYDDFKQDLDSWKDKFSELLKNKKAGRPIVIRLAVGSYGDVLDWYKHDLVDVAVLSPELVAEFISTYKGETKLEDLYIANHASTNDPSKNSLEYKAVCVVSKNSPVDDFSKLQQWAKMGKINFLFVHPLSVSGRILPEYILRSYGISNLGKQPLGGSPWNSVTWTYSHSETVKELVDSKESGMTIDSPNSRVMVGFVKDDSVTENVRAISFPNLDMIPIPQEVVLINHDFLDYKKDMLNLFGVKESQGRFQSVNNWRQQFEKIRLWIERLGISSRDQEAQSVTLEQIGKILRNYEDNGARPARLALVLSGGGAKCAYQLGAIEAIESELAKISREGNKEKVDIELVVGTSGGAINALVVALGLTRDQGDRQSRDNIKALETTWKEFDQRDFLSPWRAVRVMLGLSVGLIQALLIIWLIVALARKRPGLYKYSWIFMLAAALVNIILVVFTLNPPWASLGKYGRRHLWHHLWIVGTLNMDISALCLILIGLAMLIGASRFALARANVLTYHRVIFNSLIVVVVATILLSLFVEDTLSRSSGVERALAKKVSKLITSNQQLNKMIQGSPDAKGAPTIEEISQQIMDQRLLQRDLVITGSRLRGENNLMMDFGANDPLPDDLYFYYDKRKGESPTTDNQTAPCDIPKPKDERFKPFDQHLMDVVIGSSSIYPIFPSRPLKKFLSNSDVQIIDGGFAHNSPIEAAVLWKATHIILIEASPVVPPSHSSLLYNTIEAFNHLYYQAQLLDARSRKKVEIFTLRPESSNTDEYPDLCTFDFTENLVKTAISRGKYDANNIKPRFHREPGEPDFIDVNLASSETPRPKCE